MHFASLIPQKRLLHHKTKKPVQNQHTTFFYTTNMNIKAMHLPGIYLPHNWNEKLTRLIRKLTPMRDDANNCIQTQNERQKKTIWITMKNTNYYMNTPEGIWTIGISSLRHDVVVCPLFVFKNFSFIFCNFCALFGFVFFYRFLSFSRWAVVLLSMKTAVDLPLSILISFLFSFYEFHFSFLPFFSIIFVMVGCWILLS